MHTADPTSLEVFGRVVDRITNLPALLVRQNVFLVAQEVILHEMLETEARAAGCVDLHDAGKSQAAWLVAGCNGGGCGFAECVVAPSAAGWECSLRGASGARRAAGESETTVAEDESMVFI
jgi:hypothetical protein